jgi:hypothetical protein
MILKMQENADFKLDSVRDVRHGYMAFVIKITTLL